MKVKTTRLLVAVLMCCGAGAVQADQTTGGVSWLDPLAYQKPFFVPITIPTIATNYYIDMTSGSNTAVWWTFWSPRSRPRNR